MQCVLPNRFHSIIQNLAIEYIFETRSKLFISFLKERTLVGVTLVDQRHIIKGLSLTPSHGFKLVL